MEPKIARKASPPSSRSGRRTSRVAERQRSCRVSSRQSGMRPRRSRRETLIPPRTLLPRHLRFPCNRVRRPVLGVILSPESPRRASRLNIVIARRTKCSARHAKPLAQREDIAYRFLIDAPIGGHAVPGIEQHPVRGRRCALIGAGDVGAKDRIGLLTVALVVEPGHRVQECASESADKSGCACAQLRRAAPTWPWYRPTTLAAVSSAVKPCATSKPSSGELRRQPAWRLSRRSS